jgi:putative ABC transport system permease protein
MSIDVRMAWRNIWRNPRRTILTIAAISFACLILVFMLSFQLGSYETMINSSVKISTGHIQIQADQYQDKKSMRLVVPNPDEIGNRLENIAGIEAFTFRASAFSLVSSNKRTYGILVTGIDPQKEANVSTIKSLIREGEYFSGEDQNKALIGKLLAQRLRAGVGDELTLLGQGRDGSIAATVVTIKGIFSSGIDAFDRSALQIPLRDFQAVYQMLGAVHEVVVVGKSLGQISAIKQQIKTDIKEIGKGETLVVLDWMELMPGLLQGIEMDLVSGIIMYIILILVVAFSILNTFLMSIFERTREFGVLMAIGTSPGRLIKLVFIESMSLTAVGVFLGIILGSLITLCFQHYGIDLSDAGELMKQYGLPQRIHPKLSLVSATAGPIIVFLVTIVASIIPAFKILKLRPVQAMTHV